jgi:hypothetical protein
MTSMHGGFARIDRDITTQRHAWSCGFLGDLQGSIEISLLGDMHGHAVFCGELVGRTLPLFLQSPADCAVQHPALLHTMHNSIRHGCFRCHMHV